MTFSKCWQNHRLFNLKKQMKAPLSNARSLLPIFYTKQRFAQNIYCIIRRKQFRQILDHFPTITVTIISNFYRIEQPQINAESRHHSSSDGILPMMSLHRGQNFLDAVLWWSKYRSFECINCRKCAQPYLGEELLHSSPLINGNCECAQRANCTKHPWIAVKRRKLLRSFWAC